MKHIPRSLRATALCLALVPVALVFGQTPDNWMAGFKMPDVKEPAIPQHTTKITDFGAVPGGKTLCTDAIAKGIDSLAAQGGGRLVIPAGAWLTGPIVLKSNIELRVEEGAMVQFTKDTTQFKGRALISGENLDNIAITGRGIFDGAGEAWRPVKHYKMTELQWKALVASGGRVDQQQDMWFPAIEGGGGRRPNMMILRTCRRVLLEDTTFQNSPAWNLNPSFCDDVTIRNVTIRNPWYSQNGDGLDLESCKNVIIRGTRLDVGDDALCMKSGVGADARKNGRPTENVLIEDCVVYHGHGGFTIGSEMSGGVRNIRVNNCVFMGTDIGLRFKTQRGRGGVVEKIYLSNIQMTNIPTDAISFNMYYGGAGPTEEADNGLTESKAAAVGDGTPQFRDIYIENVTCRGARRAVQLQGLPEMPISGIHLRNVSITAEQGLVCQDAQNISLSGVEIFNGKGPVVSLVGSKGVTIDKLSYNAGAETLFKVYGKNNSGIAVNGTDVKAAKQAVDLAGGAQADALKLN
jgi:polygalacturonase